MNWTGKRVLVTGAGGFIGSHLVEELVRRGGRVRALVHYNALGSIANLQFVPREIIERIEVVAGDVCDAHAVRAYAEDVSVIFHLAALIGIPYSYVAPSSYVGTNIGGTLNVLEAARSAKCERVVITSTSETYGTAQYTPIDEKHPAVGQSPYAATKIGADQLALSYYRSFGLPITIVRPFNTFGPRQSERAIIPTIVGQALFNGGAVRLGSLEPRRDLTFVSDTARGFVCLAESEEAIGRAVNLGTGRSHSVRELVEMIGRELDLKVQVSLDPQRIRPDRSEVHELCADPTLAHSLGWSAQVPLEVGLAAVRDFMRARGPEVLRSAAGYRI
jgi:NAD dependent epimerase/dehydratase